MKNTDIPFGYCKCGCGNKTPLAPQTRSHLGHTQGRPCHYLPGHNRRWAQPAADRFWAKVARCGPDDCWPWQGKPGAYGYGRFHYEGRQQNASRVAWMLTNGPLPEGLCACHRCDNRICCNPAHLFVGTKADNNHDMYRKGRANPPSGERHYRAKLTAGQVQEIRSLYAAKKLSPNQLAARFRVSRRTIRAILDGSRWQSVS